MEGCRSQCECHGHIFMDGADFSRARDRHKSAPDLADIRAHLAAYQARGITYFRDGGDPWGVSLRARELAGEYGICYVTPAFAIHRNGRYGAIVGQGYASLGEYRALVGNDLDHQDARRYKELTAAFTTGDREAFEAAKESGLAELHAPEGVDEPTDGEEAQ